MPDISRPYGSTDVSVYARLDTVVAATATLTSLMATNQLITAANLVPLVSELGAFGSTGNSVEVPIFGERVARRFATLASPLETSITLLYDRDETSHVNLTNPANLQKELALAIVASTGSNERVALVVNAFLAGQEIQHGTGEMTTAVLSIATSGTPLILAQA